MAGAAPYPRRRARRRAAAPSLLCRRARASTWQVRVVSGGGSEWFPVDAPEWKPPRPGDEGTIYVVKAYPSGEVHEVTDASLLRSCWLWDSASRRYEPTLSRELSLITMPRRIAYH